jgi:uncharacterized protein (DUF2267 family)/osmotically-inducible protein OsmY
VSSSGLDVFDKTLQTTHIWLDELMEEIGPDRQVAWHVLGAVLRRIRARLPIELAAHLGAQLPLLVRGAYYDQWRPRSQPDRSRSLDEFLEDISWEVRNTRPVNVREATRAVFRLLSRHIDRGQVENVREAMPSEVRAIWPHQVDFAEGRRKAARDRSRSGGTERTGPQRRTKFGGRRKSYEEPLPEEPGDRRMAESSRWRTHEGRVESQDKDRWRDRGGFEDYGWSGTREGWRSDEGRSEGRGYGVGGVGRRRGGSRDFDEPYGSGQEGSIRGDYRDRGFGGEGGGYGAERYGREAYGWRSDQGGPERGYFDQASDEVSSWFEDRDAERRRNLDQMRAGEHRGRGPKGYIRSDERIREDVCQRLTDDPWVDASEIEVAVSNFEVTLSGTVENRETRRRAEDCAENVRGVTHVQNNIRVGQARMGGSREGAATPFRTDPSSGETPLPAAGSSGRRRARTGSRAA